MKRTIWKFPLPITDEPKVIAPDGAKPLHVGLDPSGASCVWMEVDKTKADTIHTFHLYGTGHPMPDSAVDRGDYIGSFNDGPAVWHIFYCAKRD